MDEGQGGSVHEMTRDRAVSLTILHAAEHWFVLHIQYSHA